MDLALGVVGSIAYFTANEVWFGVGVGGVGIGVGIPRLVVPSLAEKEWGCYLEEKKQAAAE